MKKCLQKQLPQFSPAEPPKGRPQTKQETETNLEAHPAKKALFLLAFYYSQGSRQRIHTKPLNSGKAAHARKPLKLGKHMYMQV